MSLRAIILSPITETERLIKTMTPICSYCGTKSEVCFRTMDYNRRRSLASFDHYRCPNCNLIFISPIPENLGHYYPKTYYLVPKSTDVLDAVAAHEKYKIKIIKDYVEKGRLLEIGPSIGAFAYLAKKCGFEAEAIEMDPACSQFLNEVAGIPTVNSSDTSGALKKLQPYDVIALWHVIEHLPDPWETLEVISETLNPGGILVVAAPNPDAFQFNILGRYWPHVDAPRHLFLIPSKILKEKMATLGMKTELATTKDEGGIGWNIFGWEYFFANLNSHRMVKLPLRVLGRLLAKVLSPIEMKEGKGSAYTMVFRKGV